VSDCQAPIILILGPTAGGKTELAIRLAQRLAGAHRLGGECIGADSMQVYRGMDIGTAKPNAEQRQAVPHHLLDVADPADDDFNVDRWLELAERAIADIRARRRYPIVVGGTNLYVKMLLTGICDAPPPQAAVRGELQLTPQDELRAQLESVDPAAAARIHPNDRRRTIRALEVFQLSGRRLSELQTQWTEAIREDALIIGIDYPVQTINSRINARVMRMIHDGLVDEVRGLHKAGAIGRQAREALGYKQIIDHLEGRCSLEDAIEEIKIRTRRFAKQQRTWLRRFRMLPRSLWHDASQLTSDEILERSLAFIAECSQGRPLCDAARPVQGRDLT
jgi:tRNA dimethylallyltransferase